MAGLPVVLCLHDTTELHFNGQTVEGPVPLSYEAQRGMCLHPAYAVSTDRQPLGVLDAWMWAREPRAADGQRGGIGESGRWIERYEWLAESGAEMPETRLVQVGHWESDTLDLMRRAHGLGWPLDLLVQAQHNRRLPDGPLVRYAVHPASARRDRIHHGCARRAQRARCARNCGSSAPGSVMTMTAGASRGVVWWPARSMRPPATSPCAGGC